MSYQQKYLKYKRKQLNQFGGELCPVCNLEIVDGSCQCQGVKISYFPHISGTSEELGLSDDEKKSVSLSHGRVMMFNFDPEPLIEGVHFSYTTNPPIWDSLGRSENFARSTSADLLTKIKITFVSTGRYIGEIKPGTRFELIQYNSKETPRMEKRNKASFLGRDISK